MQKILRSMCGSIRSSECVAGAFFVAICVRPIRIRRPIMLVSYHMNFLPQTPGTHTRASYFRACSPVSMPVTLTLTNNAPPINKDNAYRLNSVKTCDVHNAPCQVTSSSGVRFGRAALTDDF